MMTTTTTTETLTHVRNPWTGCEYSINAAEITEQELDNMAVLMDDDLREQIHAELAPCTPGEFCARYAELNPEHFSVIYHS